MRLRRLAAASLLALWAVLPVRAAQAAAAPVDLGTLLGPSGSSSAFGINDAGIIVGESSVAGGIRAVMWKSGAIKALPVPAGTVLSNALWVNNNGAAVGWGEDANSVVHALLWTGLSGATQTVAVLLPGFNGKVSAATINDRGEIVGSVLPTGSNQRAVRFVNNNTAVVDVLPGPNPNLIKSVGAYITNLASGTNLVFGTYSSNHPFEQGSAPAGSGGVSYLPEPTGTSYSSVAKASTDGSVAVGTYRISTGPSRAQLWTAVRSGGVISSWNWRDLGTLGGTKSFARGVNPAGTTVVGASYLPTEVQHAFVWQSGTGMRALGGLSTDPSCYAGAVGINASGRIVGESCAAGGTSHAVYWN